MLDRLREYRSKAHEMLNKAVSFSENVDVVIEEDITAHIPVLDTNLGQMLYKLLSAEHLWRVFELLYLEHNRKIDVMRLLHLNYYEINKRIQRIRFLINRDIIPQLPVEREYYNNSTTTKGAPSNE